jgi:hypothetical protein
LHPKRTWFSVARSAACVDYNSAILLRLLDKYQTGKNSKAFVLLKTISPIAWQHIRFHGHYTCRNL